MLEVWDQILSLSLNPQSIFVSIVVFKTLDKHAPKEFYACKLIRCLNNRLASLNPESEILYHFVNSDLEAASENVAPISSPTTGQTRPDFKIFCSIVSPHQGILVEYYRERLKYLPS